MKRTRQHPNLSSTQVTLMSTTWPDVAEELNTGLPMNTETRLSRRIWRHLVEQKQVDPLCIRMTLREARRVYAVPSMAWAKEA